MPSNRCVAARVRRFAVAALCVLALAGCRQDMHDQPKLEPYEVSDMFADGRGSRAPVEGTVPRGFLHADSLLYTGSVNGQLSNEFPFPVTRDVLERGRDEFDAFCSPCHGRTGLGNGMIVQRGFRPPPSFHQERLRTAPVGHFFDVMTRGFGVMPDYRAQVAVEDRWAIAAYIRALQYSQHAPLGDVPEADRPKLDAPVSAEQPAPAHGAH